MTRERNAYNQFRKGVMQNCDRIDRVENICCNGMPDISYCIDGVEGWIELKAPIEPKTSKGKLFKHKVNHHLNQYQMNWFLRQRNAGGHALILISTDKRWMLIDGEYADEVNNMSVQELMDIAKWVAMKPIDQYFWTLLRKVMVEL